MSRKYSVIDADGHVLEPFTLLNDYMDPQYRERAPKLVKDKDGNEQPASGGQAPGQSGGVRRYRRSGRQARHRRRRRDGLQGRTQGRFRSAWAHPDMDAEVSTPRFSIRASGCSWVPREPAFPRRLPGLQPLARRLLQTLSRAALRRGDATDAIDRRQRRGDALRRKELGFRAGFIRPNPYNGRILHYPDYDPLWKAAQELNFSHRHPWWRKADSRRSR